MFIMEADRCIFPKNGSGQMTWCLRLRAWLYEGVCCTIRSEQYLICTMDIFCWSKILSLLTQTTIHTREVRTARQQMVEIERVVATHTSALTIMSCVLKFKGQLSCFIMFWMNKKIFSLYMRSRPLYM